MDNVVVFLMPLYLFFELSWLITGTVWTFNVGTINGTVVSLDDPGHCDHTIYVFSIVVVTNFWVHVLTPLVFLVSLCCSRICPCTTPAAFITR